MTDPDASDPDASDPDASDPDASDPDPSDADPDTSEAPDSSDTSDPADAPDSSAPADAGHQAPDAPVPGDRDDADWAARYLESKLADPPSEASAEHGPAPDAGEFMAELTDANLSYVHPRSRGDHLETAVAALVAALTDEDGVGESDLHGRPASAYRDDERVVVLMEGLGEVVNVDRGTAALIAFAYERQPTDRFAGGRGPNDR